MWWLLTSQFIKADSSLWARGAAVGLPLDGAALACALRLCEKILVLMPTRQDAITLYSDTQILGIPEAFLMEEPPLDADALEADEAFLRRGHTLSSWLNSENGLLIATPGAITTPFRFGKTGLELKTGKATGRGRLTSDRKSVV